jgi:hypothetical protein
MEESVNARGLVFVHAAPAALAPHVEWAVASVLGVPVDLSWRPQTLAPGSLRCEFSWEGRPGTGARIASAFRGWPKIRFECVEEPSTGYEGERFASTPALGLFRATTGVGGEILVSEDRLRATVARAMAEGLDLAGEVERLLGQPWDEELEPFRCASDGTQVRLLHQVV